MNFWRSSVHGQKNWTDDFFKENVMLWYHDQDLVGLCISEYGKKDIFIELKLGYEQLQDDIFDWIENTWDKNKAFIYVDLKDTDFNRIKLLESYDYHFKEHCENERFYRLEGLDLNYSLEEGYKIQAFCEHLNDDSRVKLVRSAFNNTKYSKANINAIEQLDDYVKNLDLNILAPSGDLVAYCTGGVDTSQEGVAYIEPVGTHVDYRRHGFATAIIKEYFKRMEAPGMELVKIASKAERAEANYFYVRLNPLKNKSL